MSAQVVSFTFDDVLEGDRCVLLNESVEFDCVAKSLNSVIWEAGVILYLKLSSTRYPVR
jgi:hypothetical protein